MNRVALILSFVLGCGIRALACKCSSPPPEIKNSLGLAEWEAKRAQAIFDGKVERIELKGWPLKPVAGETSSEHPHLVVAFTDVRSYKTPDVGSIVVETGLGGGDCGYPFETGEKYLVYASPDESGRLQTGICTGTSELAGAGASLRFLRGEPASERDLADLRMLQSMPATARGGICGRVLAPAQLLRELSVTLFRIEPEALPFRFEEAHAESDGSFCANQLAPGKYIVAAAHDVSDSRGFRYFSYYPGVTAKPEAKIVEVKNDRSVSGIDFPLLRQSLYKVRGHVRGDHYQDVRVALVNSEIDAKSGIVSNDLGSDGSFEFEEIPPGHYSLFAFAANDEEDSITYLSSPIDLDVSTNLNGLVLVLVKK